MRFFLEQQIVYMRQEFRFILPPFLFTCPVSFALSQIYPTLIKFIEKLYLQYQICLIGSIMIYILIMHIFDSIYCMFSVNVVKVQQI